VGDPPIEEIKQRSLNQVSGKQWKKYVVTIVFLAIFISMGYFLL